VAWTARVAAVVLALAVAAWFGLGIHESHDLGDATSIISANSRLTPAQAQHVDALLGSVTALNPDREPDILRARAAAELGSNAAADKILLAVTRGEPQNLEAWAWLGRLAADHRLLLEAYGKIALLAPPVRP
jgi:hypothetical protein